VYQFLVVGFLLLVLGLRTLVGALFGAPFFGAVFSKADNLWSVYGKT
jgi:hypothetical protein